MLNSYSTEPTKRPGGSSNCQMREHLSRSIFTFLHNILKKIQVVMSCVVVLIGGMFDCRYLSSICTIHNNN